MAWDITDISPLECEAVEASDILIGCRGVEAAEVMPNANTPLIGMGWLQVVRHEEHLSWNRTAANEVDQTLSTEVGRIPRRLTGVVPKVDDVIRMLQTVRFIDRIVERQSVVIDAPSPEDRRRGRLIDGIGKAQPRLDRAVKTLSLRTISEIAIWIDRHKAAV